MVVYRHGKRALGTDLTDHIAVEQVKDLLGLRKRLFSGLGTVGTGLCGLRRHAVHQFVVHRTNAFAADEFALDARKEFIAVAFAATAERAISHVGNSGLARLPPGAGPLFFGQSAF